MSLVFFVVVASLRWSLTMKDQKQMSTGVFEFPLAFREWRDSDIKVRLETLETVDSEWDQIDQRKPDDRLVCAEKDAQRASYAFRLAQIAGRSMGSRFVQINADVETLRVPTRPAIPRRVNQVLVWVRRVHWRQMV